MPYEPPPDLAGMSLMDIVEAIAARKLPPVSEWQPVEEAESRMRIAADGRWYYEGSEITRPAMVRAFAALLRREQDGRHWLVLPYQKQHIAVEDAAFIATDMTARDGALAFHLNTDDIVMAGPDNPLLATGNPDVPAIYLAVRNGCKARLDRSTYVQLAELALAQGDDWTVTSKGMRFSLVPQ